MINDRILLTGGAGMVGRNILEHPESNHFEILAPTSSELDLANYEAVLSYINSFKPNFIVHAAGRVGGIQANIANPVEFLESNISINRNIIMAAYHSGVSNFLNLASTCMYPRNAENPLREDMILKGELEPTNEGYALAKITATRLCQYIRREKPDMQYKTIIPCNLYGRHDKFNPKHSHLVPAVIRKIHLAKANGDEKVEIWGDGMARREFMYAGDLADAVIKALGDLSALPDLMNCGVGRDHTIKSYYEAVAEVIGWDGTFTYDLSKPVGMRQKLCAVELQSAWGWNAKTPLRDGIREAYSYYINEDFK